MLCDDSTFLIVRSPLMQSKLEPDRVEYDGVYSPHKMRDWLLANVLVDDDDDDVNPLKDRDVNWLHLVIQI